MENRNGYWKYSDKTWILPNDRYKGYIRDSQTSEIMSVVYNNDGEAVDIMLEKVKDDQKCHKSNWLKTRTTDSLSSWFLLSQYSSNDLYLTAGTNETLTVEGKVPQSI